MIAATSPSGQLVGLSQALQIQRCRTFGACWLLLPDPLQRPLDRGQGLPRVDEREGPQSEPVRQKADEDVRAHLALAGARLVLDDP